MEGRDLGPRRLPTRRIAGRADVVPDKSALAPPTLIVAASLAAVAPASLAAVFKVVGRDSTLGPVAKNMIIGPGEGAAASSIARAARAAGWRVLLARASGGAEAAGPKAGHPRSPLPPISGEGDILAWNPASYVSAGALAINASALGDIEALVLVSEPENGGPALFDGAPGSLASRLEEATLGPIWLAREIIRRFEAGGGGRILAISVEGPDEAQRVPGELAWAAYLRSAFRGFGEGLFDRARNARWKAWGIVDKSGKSEALGDFAIALLEEGREAKSGRWLPFNGKSGIFGIF